MKNEFEVRGDVTAIYLKSRRYGRLETIISTSKLHIAMKQPKRWFARWDESCKTFYVCGIFQGVDGKRIDLKLHRILVSAPTDMVVDHRNHSGLDNTDGNLRICSRGENTQNKRSDSVRSTSGVRGVSWHKRINKWRAAVGINGRTKHIGYFENIEEAEKAVKQARSRYMAYSQEASSM